MSSLLLEKHSPGEPKIVIPGTEIQWNLRAIERDEDRGSILGRNVPCLKKKKSLILNLEGAVW